MSEHNFNLYANLLSSELITQSTVAIETAEGLFYTWQDLHRASAMMANYLESLDIAKGSRIAVQVDKSVEAVILYLATLRAGYVFLPLNTAYQSAELDYFIRNAEPAVVVCTSKNFSWLSKLSFTAGVEYVFTLNDDRTGSLLDRATQQSDVHEVVFNNADDLAAILYTSGTTGRSKGAMLSHHNLLSNAQILKDYWGWQKGDVLIHALPIFHVHGLFVALHAAFLNGSTILWHQQFVAKNIIQQLPRATVFMGVPTLYVRLLQEPLLSPELCKNMRLFISGSAPLLIETFNTFKERTNHTILERYGMTETAMLTSNPYNADPRFENQSERRGATVGFPLPQVQLRVMLEDGSEAKVNEIGKIQVKGPNVFAGYWRMPEKTAEEFTLDGFFMTGDLGKIDEKSYVHIVGRSKDLIISGGYNVYPAELESYINEMPGVEESALVGVPHADFGEVGVALVIAKPNAVLEPQSIVAQLKAKVANFKVPKQCFIVQSFPKNAMGKVQKNVLREEYKNLFL